MSDGYLVVGGVEVAGEEGDQGGRVMRQTDTHCSTGDTLHQGHGTLHTIAQITLAQVTTQVSCSAASTEPVGWTPILALVQVSLHVPPARESLKKYEL